MKTATQTLSNMHLYTADYTVLCYNSIQTWKEINWKETGRQHRETYNVGDEDAILMSDDAEAKTVTRLLNEVGCDYVIGVIVTAWLVAKDNEADYWRRLTQYTDGVLVSHIFKTFTTNLNITRISTTR